MTSQERAELLWKQLCELYYAKKTNAEMIGLLEYAIRQAEGVAAERMRERCAAVVQGFSGEGLAAVIRALPLTEEDKNSA